VRKLREGLSTGGPHQRRSNHGDNSRNSKTPIDRDVGDIVAGCQFGVGRPGTNTSLQRLYFTRAFSRHRVSTRHDFGFWNVLPVTFHLPALNCLKSISHSTESPSSGIGDNASEDRIDAK